MIITPLTLIIRYQTNAWNPTQFILIVLVVAVVDRNDEPVKPDPFGVKMLCKHFKVQPKETLVVGDYLFDLQSAKAAGAIAVLMKSSEKSEQFASFADYTVDSLTEIIDIIKSYEK